MTPRFRQWAHMLGYGGHFLTKSRRYSVTFGQLRSARTDHRRAQRHPDGERDPWGRPSMRPSSWSCTHLDLRRNRLHPPSPMLNSRSPPLPAPASTSRPTTPYDSQPTDQGER